MRNDDLISRYIPNFENAKQHKMNDREFTILKIYHELKEIPWHELRDKHTVDADFMDWAENKNDVQTVVANINQKLKEYGFIELIPRTIKIDITYKITQLGEETYNSYVTANNPKPDLNSEANEVLHILLAVENKKEGLRSDSHLLSGDLRKNAVEIFRFIQSRLSNLIWINQSNDGPHLIPRLVLTIIIQPQGFNRIKPFLDFGGFKRFKNHIDYENTIIGKSTGYQVIPHAAEIIVDNSQHFHGPVSNSSILKSNNPQEGASINQSASHVQPETGKKKNTEFIKWLIGITIALVAVIIAWLQYNKDENNKLSEDVSQVKSDSFSNDNNFSKKETMNPDTIRGYVNSKKNDSIIPINDNSIIPKNIRQTKSIDDGNSENFFDDELIISLIATAFEGDPLRHTVIANISSPGMKVININHKDIGYAIPYKGKHNYIITILAANTFDATFQVTKRN